MTSKNILSRVDKSAAYDQLKLMSFACETKDRLSDPVDMCVLYFLILILIPERELFYKMFLNKS